MNDDRVKLAAGAGLGGLVLDGKNVPAVPGWVVIDRRSGAPALWKEADGWKTRQNGIGDIVCERPDREPAILLPHEVVLSVGARTIRQGWHPRPDATMRCTACSAYLVESETVEVDWSKIVIGPAGKVFGVARYHPAQVPGAGKVPCGPAVFDDDRVVKLT